MAYASQLGDSVKQSNGQEHARILVLRCLSPIFCLLSLPGHPQELSNGFVLKRNVELVVLHTTVKDEHGYPVEDLQASDFIVYEDKREQALSLFQYTDVPVTVGLVLDNSVSMARNRSRMATAGMAFVEQSTPQDEFFVVYFNRTVEFAPAWKAFTTSREDIQYALGPTYVRGTTSFYDALRVSLNHIRDGTHQKKVLLIISDGLDSSSTSTFDAAYEEARQADVGLYFIVLPCDEFVETHHRCQKARREVLKLARVSGGAAYFPDTMAEAQAQGHQVARDVHKQYVLAYTPTKSTGDGNYRRLRVDVRVPGRPGMVTRHRQGYYAAPARHASK